jgi:hypothetical protein
MNSQNLGPAVYDRDREMEERHRALQQREEMARRDQEREREQRDRERDRDRESNERYQSTPHHSSAGSIPIHQPVASRISGAIHSPGGLLANHNGNPQIPLGNPPGPPPLAAFGGPLQSEHNRPVQHGGSNNSNTQPQMFAPMPHGGPPTSTQAAANSVAAVFGGPLQQQPPEGQRGGQQGAPFNPAAASAAHQLPGGITQGQQPILNVSSMQCIYFCDGMLSLEGYEQPCARRSHPLSLRLQAGDATARAAVKPPTNLLPYLSIQPNSIYPSSDFSKLPDGSRVKHLQILTFCLPSARFLVSADILQHGASCAPGKPPGKPRRPCWYLQP